MMSMLRRMFNRRNARRGLHTAASLVCALSYVAPRPALATQSAPVLERITISDNAVGAGDLAQGTLTLRLEARTGEWHPDSDDGPGVVVNAFAADGRALQVPAPLIRVVEGTTVRAIVRNSIGTALFVRGLYSRPAKGDDANVVSIPYGETREITFLAGSPGTYYYWAGADAAAQMGQRVGRDTQLTGAFVVEPRGVPAQDERVLVMTSWNNGGPPGSPERRNRFAINGRSWPHTERLNYKVGDVVRMRVINAGANVHPMHLHGFYFNVDSRGDEREDAIFPRYSSPHMVVTERLASGGTFALTWTPTRPGNWLFHCHDNVHLLHGGPLDGSPRPDAGAHRHVENHALEMMAGPIIGVTVSGTSTEPPDATGARRQLRLVARVDKGGTDKEPAFGYTLDSAAAAAPPYIPGPTIVLKRGEPVSITVENLLPEPTAVHWHGIELESYYDGVAGYAGEGKRIAPAIAPGSSFEARFTPPRSGTFIYHTHLDEVRQQQAGLSGPLLVVDEPEKYDPTHDMVLMVTVPRTEAAADVVLLNGSSTPLMREMRVGEPYRLRFINLHTARPSMRMRLLTGTTLLQWRGLAKDGMDLPLDQASVGPAEIQMGNGETYDFEFRPSMAGAIRLDVIANNGTLLVSMPIRVQ